MSSQVGISFLHSFDLGNRNVNNPGINILSVTSTAAGDFDKANLCTESVRNVWRSADVLSWQEIVIQAELSSQIDTFAIIGHNFSDDAVVIIEANIANNFLAPPFQRTVPVTEDNIVLCENFADEYEFYRVRILDPANTCGYVQIGRIVGGRAFTFTNSEDITDEIDIDTQDFADKSKTEGFFMASNEKVKARELAIKFSKLYTTAPNNVNYLGLKAMYKNVGTTKPFLTIVDRDDPAFCSLWGQIDKLPRDSFTINRFTSQSIKIMEMF